MPTRVTRTGRVVAVPIDTGICYGSGMLVRKTHKGKCPKCGREVGTEGQPRADVRYYVKHLRPSADPDTIDLYPVTPTEGNPVDDSPF